MQIKMPRAWCRPYEKDVVWWMKATGYMPTPEGNYICWAVRKWARPYIWLKRRFPRLP